MKERISYLLKFAISTVLIFVLQKPLFMLYNGTMSKGCSFIDYLQVMRHGLTLDLSMMGYILILPLLLCILSIRIKLPYRKILLIYQGIVAVLIALTFIGDTSLFEFWHFKLDATILTYIDSPKNASASVSVGFLIIRIIAFIAQSVLLYYVFKYCTPHFKSVLKRPVLCLLTFLILSGVLTIIIRGGIKESTANIGKVYYSDNQFLNQSAVNPFFSFLHSISKQKDFSKEFQFFDEEKMLNNINGIYNTQSIDTENILKTKRPNILIILMEGFGGTMVETIGGEQGVTPNFNRLSKEGILFTNCYANSFRTDRGLVCFFSSFPGLPTTSVMKIPPLVNTMPSLVAEIKKVGYQTDFLYGGDINFTNMQGYLRTMGFQKITSDVNFSFAEQNSSKWGVHDETTFDYLFEQIKNKTDNLWLTSLLTLSSHDPFDVPYKRLDDKVFNSFAYTDECLGKFIDKLKQLPAWENLLVICIPDHGCFYPKDFERSHPKYYRIPMLWLGGAIKKPMTFDKIMNQTDVTATLLSQLNLSHKNFEYSRDVFGKNYKYPSAFYTYNNGFAFIDSTGISVFDNNAEKLVFGSDANNEIRLNKGKSILQTIYKDLGKRQ